MTLWIQGLSTLACSAEIPGHCWCLTWSRKISFKAHNTILRTCSSILHLECPFCHPEKHLPDVLAFLPNIFPCLPGFGTYMPFVLPFAKNTFATQYNFLHQWQLTLVNNITTVMQQWFGTQIQISWCLSFSVAMKWKYCPWVRPVGWPSWPTKH